jgi:hypothetical protein
MNNIIILADPTRTIINLNEWAAFRSCQEYSEEEQDNGDISMEDIGPSIHFVSHERCSEFSVLYGDTGTRDLDYEKIIAKLSPNQ